MSNVIAPLPGGLVTVVAEHHARRDPDPHHAPEEETAEDSSGGERHSADERQHKSTQPVAPVVDDPGVPAEMLFAAALFANRMLPNAPSPEEYQLRRPQEWTPPESSLRLKDRLA